MNHKKLFSSTTEPIPALRRDLQVIPIEENGEPYLYFHDERQYIDSNLALVREAGSLLSLLDGEKSIDDLGPYLENGVSKSRLLKFVQFLDENRLLASDYFRQHAQKIEAQYEQTRIHQSVTAGTSYPDEPDILRSELDAAFLKNETRTVASEKTRALFAPHIDPRVALDSYVNAFAPIKNLRPERVVIIATSHYAGLYPDLYANSPFVLVNKNFDLPLSSVQRDRQVIDKLLESVDGSTVTTRDRAHRMEHSIELHLLFLSYMWDHDFKIVPFLVRGLDDLYYMEEGHLGQQLNDFSSMLRNQFGGDEETFFLISGDLAHFGNKFGDELPASSMFEDVKDFDKQFLARASDNQPKALLELMKRDMDPYRICGFPPLYTFLNSMPNLQGEVLGYDLWDERERDSAVTFGSILYNEQ